MSGIHINTGATVPTSQIDVEAQIEKAKRAQVMGDPTLTIDEKKHGKKGAGPLTQHDLMPPPDNNALHRVAHGQGSDDNQDDDVQGSNGSTSANPYQSKVGGDTQQAATAGLMAAMSAEIKQQQTSAKFSEVSRQSQLQAYVGKVKDEVSDIEDEASDIMKQAITQGTMQIASGALSMGAGMSGGGDEDLSEIDGDEELTGITNSDNEDLQDNFTDAIKDDKVEGVGDENLDEEDKDVDNDENEDDDQVNEEEEDPEKRAAKDQQAAKNEEQKESETEKKREAIEKNTETRKKQIEELQKSRKLQRRSSILTGMASLAGAAGTMGGAGWDYAKTQKEADQKTDEAQAGTFLTASQTANSFESQAFSSIETTISMMGSVLSQIAEAKSSTAKA